MAMGERQKLVFVICGDGQHSDAVRARGGSELR